MGEEKRKEKSNDQIGNRTRNLPACRTVPQPTNYVPIIRYVLNGRCCFVSGSYRDIQIASSDIFATDRIISTLLLKYPSKNYIFFAFCDWLTNKQTNKTLLQ
jgi:hypothetical protein